MIEALEKLRNELKACQKTLARPRPTIAFALQKADEIQAEVERDYMRLPVDSDGVPIRIGDLLDAPEGEEYGVVEVVELTFDGEDWYFKGEVPLSFMGLAGYFNTAGWRHYRKPRTVEDVLREMISMTDQPLCEEDIQAFAAEIRELMQHD